MGGQPGGALTVVLRHHSLYSRKSGWPGANGTKGSSQEGQPRTLAACQGDRLVGQGANASKEQLPVHMKGDLGPLGG